MSGVAEQAVEPRTDAKERESAAVATDRLEALLVYGDVEKLDLPLHHVFTPGLYTREILLPAGSLTISKIHKTQHPFVISKGRVAVWTEADGVVVYAAPHTGVTKPGTRRVIYAYEDTIWSTFHRTNETDLEKIEAEIIEPHELPPDVIETALHCLKTHDHVTPALS